jgi:hypothetical protein
MQNNWASWVHVEHLIGQVDFLLAIALLSISISHPAFFWVSKFRQKPINFNFFGK